MPNAATTVPYRLRGCALGSARRRTATSSSMIGRSDRRSRRRARRSRSFGCTRASRRPARHRRRAAIPAPPIVRVDRATHSPDDSLLSSARNRRRARNSATRALLLDMPTASAAGAICWPSTSTMYKQRAHRGGSASRSDEITRIRIGRRAVGRDLRRRARGPSEPPALVGREVHDHAPQVRTELTDLARLLRQHLGERLLHQIVGLDVPPPDHRREPPERLVLLPQRLERRRPPTALRRSSPSSPPPLVSIEGTDARATRVCNSAAESISGRRAPGERLELSTYGLTGRLLCRLSYPGMAPEDSSARTRPMTSR